MYKYVDKILGFQFFTDGNFGFCIMDTIYSYPGPKYVYWYDYAANYLAQNEVAYYDGFLGELKKSISRYLQLFYLNDSCSLFFHTFWKIDYFIRFFFFLKRCFP